MDESRLKDTGMQVGAAPRGRPLINMELQFNNISDENKSLGNGPAQGPAPTHNY